MEQLLDDAIETMLTNMDTMSGKARDAAWHNEPQRAAHWSAAARNLAEGAAALLEAARPKRP